MTLSICPSLISFLISNSCSFEIISFINYNKKPLIFYNGLIERDLSIKYRNVIVGGKELEYTYADCQKEMDMLNKALIEVMLEGDSKGNLSHFRL